MLCSNDTCWTERVGLELLCGEFQLLLLVCGCRWIHAGCGNFVQMSFMHFQNGLCPNEAPEKYSQLNFFVFMKTLVVVLSLRRTAVDRQHW